jgi:transcription-repair coupling factor (superfamily II helicase)
MQHIYKAKQKSYWGSLHGSSKYLEIIEFAKQKEQPLLVIANDVAHYNDLCESFSFYGDNLPILKFDDCEVLAFDHFSPHPNITASRIKTLASLKNLTQGIVVTTLESLVKRLCPIQFIEQNSFTIRVGNEINTKNFIDKLLKIGYIRVTNVMESGEFSIKGSIIDLYPIGAELPYRIDLFDVIIDSIRVFDVLTKRSIKNIEQISLLPAKEFAINTNSIELFKDNYVDIFGNKNDFVFKQVCDSRLFPGIEFYLPLFFTSTNTLFDYLNKDFIVITHAGFNKVADVVFANIEDRYQKVSSDIERKPLPIYKVFITKDKLFSYIKQQGQVVVSSAKIPPNKNGVNFAIKLLPPLQIKTQNKKPLDGLLRFIETFHRRILIVCESNSRKSILIELLTDNGFKPKSVKKWHEFIDINDNLCIVNDSLNEGFLAKDIAVITDKNLFGSDIVNQQARTKNKHSDISERIKSLIEIKIGDAVVHEKYGVGRYLGLETHNFDDLPQDFLILKYANNAKLMVPITSLDTIFRYSGHSLENAPLHKLGTSQWNKAKRKACEDLHDVASELLEIYAKRQAQNGFAFPEPSDDYSLFVSNFKFEETTDQIKTMTEVLNDMQSSKPMDRLVCGDVGFGKTEIAMRAAFLAVDAGKQVAILVPTTLLSSQHYQSFVDRFIDYPIKIESFSRFKTSRQQTQIKNELSTGKIDIVIGTHKLIQNDIKYHNLGLIIIDEEHRFGVKQKETLKKLRGKSDILTMTATPIPRTLNMALGYLRDLSVIATPPKDRSAIQTFVHEWSDEIIKEACLRELHRNGQIFVLHNNIETINSILEKFKLLMPNVNISVAHGRMPARELEDIMSRFYHGYFQILVATTIIETGIDIPNANTIIINDAQNFGLSQLHQLRGRVGRSHHRAYAYLIVKNRNFLSKDAKKRLDAIESLDKLGSGFMLANYDLEIRGAGDLLGEKQSGKINEIGFSLYNDLLNRTIPAIVAGEKINQDDIISQEVHIDTGIPCLIPSTYIRDVHDRLILYKRIANAKDFSTLRELQIEMIDIFGSLLDPIKNLFAISKVKIIAQENGVEKIIIYDDRVIITFKENSNIKVDKIIELVQAKPNQYQIKKQNKFIYKKEMPKNIKRIDIVENLLIRLINR